MSSAQLVTFLVLAIPISEANAEDLTLQVGPKDKLFRAFERASEHLTSCKTCVVTIQIAGGEQRGKAQVGQWIIPETIAPKATLRVLGGFDATFAKRAPFEHPTVLMTSERRSGPVLEIRGKTALKELHVSGLAIDVGPGNRYDPRSGSLHKGASSSWPILAFGGLTADRLILSDNIFANAANGVGGPRITPATDESEIVVRNNLFLNNVYCWQVAGLPTNRIVKRYVIEGNSFIRNFPYNPDQNTSNPGTIEIGNKYAAGLVVMRRNLFADNWGGAIFPQWEDTVGPKMEIAENLFHGNGALFEQEGEGYGAVVGKFNGSGVHGSYTPEDLEDFSWNARGNVVLDPKLALPNSEPSEAEGDQPEEDEYGVKIERNRAIDSYAPRWILAYAALPFPAAAEAKEYGASASKVVTP